MTFHLDFSDEAKKDIEYFKKSGNKSLLVKIAKLLEELKDTPFSGTGKPEPLRYELTGKWSRRINKEHRLVYEVTEETVNILSMKGHY